MQMHKRDRFHSPTWQLEARCWRWTSMSQHDSTLYHILPGISCNAAHSRQGHCSVNHLLFPFERHLWPISNLEHLFRWNTCRFTNKTKMSIQKKKCSSRDQEILGRHAFAGVLTLPRYFHGIKCHASRFHATDTEHTYHAPRKPRNGQYKKESKSMSWNNNQALWLFSKKFNNEAASPPRRARRPRSCVGCRIRRLLPLRRGLELLRTYIEYNGWVLQVPESFAGPSWQVYMKLITIFPTRTVCTNARISELVSLTFFKLQRVRMDVLMRAGGIRTTVVNWLMLNLWIYPACCRFLSPVVQCVIGFSL